MNRRLIYVCLCITLLSSFSCSKEYDDEMKYLQSAFDMGAAYDALAGKYSGAWWINGEQVSDSLSTISCLRDGYTKEPVIGFGLFSRGWGFPYKPIAERLFPNKDIANLPYNSVQPRYNILTLIIIGYSNNQLYCTPQPQQGDAYVPLWFQIFEDNTEDHIIAVRLDIVPYESIIMLDWSQSQSLSLKWLVKKVEIYEYYKGQEEVKTVRVLDPEMKLAFIGTRINN